MEKFLYEQRAILEIIDYKADKILEKHSEFLESNFSDMRKFENFMNELFLVKEDKLLPQELEFLNDIKGLREFYTDLRALNQKLQSELELELRQAAMPVFVERHPVLRAKWLEIQKEINENMMDLTDVN